MEVKTKKQRIYIALTLLSAVFSVGSCDYVGKYLGELKQDERNPAVARVDDVYLYRNDIPSIVPKGSSQQDSAAIVKKYIDSWITRQLVLSKAQSGIDAEGLKKEVDEFRDMLLIGRYEPVSYTHLTLPTKLERHCPLVVSAGYVLRQPAAEKTQERFCPRYRTCQIPSQGC